MKIRTYVADIKVTHGKGAESWKVISSEIIGWKMLRDQELDLTDADTLDDYGDVIDELTANPDQPFVRGSMKFELL